MMDASPLRILLLTDGIYPFVIGGMQKHAFYLAKQLILQGADLTIFHCVVDEEVPDDAHARLTEAMELGNDKAFVSYCVKFPRIKPAIPGHYVLESHRLSKLYQQQIKDHEPFDFIYAKGFSAWESIKLKKGLPPIGIQFHGLEMFQEAASFKNRMALNLLKRPTKWNLLNTDYVFCYGGKIMALHQQLGCKPEQLVLQHGGVNTSRLIEETAIRPANGPLRFLFIGRNERRKGYPELKGALQSLPTDAAFTFEFIGPIDESDRLNDPRIKYHGTINNADRYFEIIDRNDVLVVPSKSEGLPTVILEAMARGMTVLSTDVGAVNAVVDESNGILLNTNEPAVLKHGMEQFFALESEELMSMKRNALETIRSRFRWEVLAADILNFISSAVSNDSRSRTRSKTI